MCRDYDTISHRVASQVQLPETSGQAKRKLKQDRKKKPARLERPVTPQKKGLMYVDVRINGKEICALVDIGATYNYLANTDVDRLGLVVEKGVG